jgi:formylglycine-generating enzyme required for sulfatase activity
MQFPYPTGYERRADTCNIDQPHLFPDLEKLANTKTQAAELERIDQRVASGTMRGCVSPFGVFDMSGNVDEWVVADSNDGTVDASRHAILKGGYFGTVRARCRPETTSHGPKFRFFQVGFRCCS